jgi:hypothetical protein
MAHNFFSNWFLFKFHERLCCKEFCELQGCYSDGDKVTSRVMWRLSSIYAAFYPEYIYRPSDLQKFSDISLKFRVVAMCKV